jgi:paired amphipathic helix protein Sin3a
MPAWAYVGCWLTGVGKAYHMFGPEKMVLALIKQAQTVLGDNRSHELWELMQRARALPAAGLLDVIRYRREAEENVSADEHLYRFDWVRSLAIACVGRSCGL